MEINLWNMNNPLKFIDLFAGIGGLGLPFRELGMKCVFSSEIDKFACLTYEANFHEKPLGDIKKINIKDIPDHDLLLAGFPCQPFSMIGQRQGFNDQKKGNLFFYLLNILKNKQPKAFLLENVPGIKSINKGKTFILIKHLLNEVGYDLFILEEDAKDYGLPQRRKRIYFIGFRKGLKINFTYLRPIFEEAYIGSFIEENKTGYALSNNIIKNYLFKKHDSKPEIVDTNSEKQIKTFVASYHKIQRLTGTFVNDHGKIRLLSENECKSLMGIPRSFIFPVSRTQMYRQIGNSVAIPVVRAIANKINYFLKTLQNDKSRKNYPKYSSRESRIQKSA